MCKRTSLQKWLVAIAFLVAIQYSIGPGAEAGISEANLVGWWKFDEGSGTTAYDSAGSNDGTLVNGTGWTSGQMGGALSFDGSGNHVDLGNNGSLKPFLPVSIGGWVKLSNLGKPQEIMSIDEQSRTYYGVWLEVLATDTVAVSFGDGQGRASQLYRRSKVGTTALGTGTWYHVAAVVKGATDMDIYINGADDAGAYSGRGGSLAYSSGNSYIGCQNGAQNYLDGAIDDLRVYDRALTGEEILQLYRDGFRGRAYNPEPTDGGGRVAVNTVLSWSPGSWSGDINGHDVYFGTDYNDVNDATTSSAEYMGNQDTNTWATDNYGPEGLEYGTWYYWRIDEVNDADVNSPWKGDVWSFVSIFSDGALRVPLEYRTIQAAINVAVDGDKIIVAPGTYTGDGNRDIDFLGKEITVRGKDPNDPNVVKATIIDCNGTKAEPHRGFYFRRGEGQDSVISGLLITNGYAINGGAIDCWGSSPTVDRCVIKGNRSRPVHKHGGGICSRYGSAPTIKYCTIVGNSAGGDGGGIYHSGVDELRMIGCTVKSNYAFDEGGGICCGRATISNCKVIANGASYMGGGIYFRPGDQRLKNCVITANSGGLVGGGIYCGKSEVEIQNCTVVSNWAKYNGAGLGVDYSELVQAVGCILWGNNLGTPRGGSGRQIGVASGYADVSYCNVEGGKEDGCGGSGVIWGTGNIDSDPCFVEAGYWDVNGVWIEGDYYLLEDSPCIDAGDPNYFAEPNGTDLDGRPRVLDGDEDGIAVVDMGAYEFEFLPAIEATVKISPNTLNVASKGKWISCYIRLPEDYNVADIEPNSVSLEDEIPAERVWLGDEFAVARFSRRAVQEMLGEVETPAEVELVVSGELSDGTIFEGTDTIRVIDKGRRVNNSPVKAVKRVILKPKSIKGL